MAWVQKYIAAFGGDRTRVMIHGCSAGGVSIANHMTQPLSWPYFTSAVMESGNQLTFTDAVSMSDAQASYDGFLQGLGCSTLDCLLALNTSQLLDAPARLQVRHHPVGIWYSLEVIPDGLGLGLLPSAPRPPPRASMLTKVCAMPV